MILNSLIISIKNIVDQLDNSDEAKVEGDNVDKDQVVGTGLRASVGNHDHHHGIEDCDLDCDDYQNDKYNVDKDHIVCAWLGTICDQDHDYQNDKYVFVMIMAETC